MTYEELWRRLVPLYDVGEAKAIVRWLLDVRFGLTLADILCGRAAELPASEQRELKQMTDRLAEGEPVQYVAELADFCGRQLHVGPGVLIPRPETAELCRWILEERGRRNEEGDYFSRTAKTSGGGGWRHESEVHDIAPEGYERRDTEGDRRDAECVQAYPPARAERK